MASIRITSPTNTSVVRGTVPVTVRVDGGGQVTDVRVVIGTPSLGTKDATLVGGVWTYGWNTLVKLSDPTVPSPDDAWFWITATATVDGVLLQAPYVSVLTNNVQPQAASRAVAGGWRDALAWAADYSGSLEQWRVSNAVVVGGAYASLQDDPVLGSARRVVKVSVPDSAAGDSDQPTSTTVRFQSSSPRVISEGDEFAVGFAFYPPDDFPSVYPRNDPSNPHGIDATGYIAILQIYGPPYVQGAAFVLHADRRSVDDPLDEFTVQGNELNPGDPAPFLSVPYRRGRWTDVVFNIRASSSITDGWIEAYVNQGESRAVRPQTLLGGPVRRPRVLLRPDSGAHRTDMQIYRVKGRFERVTLWHTSHKIARTVAEADPRSYAAGPLT